MNLKKLLPTLLTTLFFTGLCHEANATHIVGGEMTYSCLGNNQYLVKLTIFRDCFYGSPAAWFDDPASIGVFDANNNFLFQQLVDWDPVLNDTLDPELENECFTVPPDVCVHTTYYSTIITLPYLSGGYQLVYQRCCRNQTIVNLVEPLDVGATYSINISDQALLECNSSPQFNNWPPLFLCVNQPFSIDQSAVDPDGDSLVYRLCNPLSGADPGNPMPQPPNPPPFDTVPWLGNFGIDDMLNAGMGGSPMTIDPHTGLLTGTPLINGQFVIGICVEEYRNGVLIGVSRRDYQVNVGDCGEVTSSFFAPEVICKGLSVNFQNLSSNADNFLWYFDWPNGSATSTEKNPQFTYPDTGLYTVMLIAEPNAFCTDTFFAQVHLLPHSLFADFELEQAACVDSLTLQITDSSLDTLSNISSYNWQLSLGSDTLHSDGKNPVFTLNEEGLATLTLVVTSGNGCTDTLAQEFEVTFLNDPNLEDSVTVCYATGGVHLNPGGQPANASWNWQPASSLDDPSSPNPLATPDSTTTYSVLITDAQGYCQIEKEVTVIVSPFVEVSPLTDTILKGQSVQLMATYNPTYTYHWTPAAGLDNPEIHNPVASPTETTVYMLTVTDTNGCVATRSVTIVVLTLCEEPFLFIPTAFSPNGDGLNDSFRVMGNNIAALKLIVYDRWGEKLFETTTPGQGWDGNFRGKALPPDVYGYYVEVTCVGGLHFAKKGNVTLFR